MTPDEQQMQRALLQIADDLGGTLENGDFNICQEVAYECRLRVLDLFDCDDRTDVCWTQKSRAPGALITDSDGGHAFLVVDRFICDPWARDFDGRFRAVYHIDDEIEEVRRIYGDPSAWLIFSDWCDGIKTPWAAPSEPSEEAVLEDIEAAGDVKAPTWKV